MTNFSLQSTHSTALDLTLLVACATVFLLLVSVETIYIEEIDIGPHSSHENVLRIKSQYGLLQVIYNVYFHPLAKVPGPRTWSATRLPYVRALLRGTIVHDFEKMHKIYGPVLRVAPDEVTFASEEAWADILQPRSGSRQFLKDPLWWARQPGQAQTLISAIDPEEHAQIRKVLAPAFTSRALKAQETTLHRYASLLVEKVSNLISSEYHESGTDIDIGPWCNYFTFDVFGDLGFGESFGCLDNSHYHPWIALLFNSVKAASYVAAVRYYPLLRWLLMKCIPASLREQQKKHFSQIADKVQRRMNWELERPDIMSYVMREGGGKGTLTIGVIEATFAVLTTAGSETTATVLGGILNYLANINDPGTLTKLAGEVRGHFESRDQITLDSLRSLEYLNACISEGLRLCVPVPWVLPRLVPPGGALVCGNWIPGGVSVN